MTDEWLVEHGAVLILVINLLFGAMLFFGAAWAKLVKQTNDREQMMQNARLTKLEDDMNGTKGDFRESRSNLSDIARQLERFVVEQERYRRENREDHIRIIEDQEEIKKDMRSLLERGDPAHA